MFLLDTDHIGVIQRQTEPEYSWLVGRIERHPSGDFYVSVVSFHEQVSGWNAYIRRASTREAVVPVSAPIGCFDVSVRARGLREAARSAL